MFSVLHGVVLRALPYPDADRLVRIYSGDPSRGPARGGLTRAEVLEGLPDLPGFESTAYYVPPYVFSGANFARRVRVVRVSAGFFPVFGVPAALFRWLRPQLFDVGEASLWMLFAVAVLASAAAALTAALWPACRAARIAPMEARCVTNDAARQL